MRYGVTIFLTDQTIGAVEMAREVEAHGFDSLYVPEHTHIPVGRRTPAPLGEPLPEYYRRCLDPFAALAAMTAVTERIRLGTGICLVAQRDAIVTAKEVATLDHLSGGRFVFGVGFGWNQDEAEHHGVDFARRRELVRDKVRAMDALWTQDEAAYEGEHVRFAPSWQWPKPVQRPRVPVLLGGAGGPKAIEHMVAWADGWMPIGGRGLSQALPPLRQALSDAGRDPADFAVVPLGSSPDRGKFEHFASLGVEEVVAYAPPAGRDEVLPFLERYAALVEDLRGGAT